MPPGIVKIYGTKFYCCINGIMEAAIVAGDGELDNSAVIQEIRRRKHDRNL